MIWENGTETCIISYVKQIASPGSIHDTGCLGLVHWDDPEGWYREGGGRGVQDGEHVYTHLARTTSSESATDSPTAAFTATAQRRANPRAPWRRSLAISSISSSQPWACIGQARTPSSTVQQEWTECG